MEVFIEIESKTNQLRWDKKPQDKDVYMELEELLRREMCLSS